MSWDINIQFSPSQKYTEDKYYPTCWSAQKVLKYFVLFTETMFLNSL